MKKKFSHKTSKSLHDVPRKRRRALPPPDPVELFLDQLDLAIEAQTKSDSSVSTAVIVALVEMRNAYGIANGHTVRQPPSSPRPQAPAQTEPLAPPTNPDPGPLGR